MQFQIIPAVVFICGIFLIYNAVFIKPAKTAVQAVSKIKNFSFDKKYERFAGYIAGKLLKLIKISEYKRSEYQRMLEVLGLHFTPEQYTAQIAAKALLFGVLGLIPGILSPVLFICAPACGTVIYLSSSGKLKKKYTKLKNEIELDLPKLCSVINSRLQSTSNVQSILSSFLPISNAAMSAELTVTLADMKTGNVETALRRFEGRISSPKVSDIVRGLIAVQNGDDLRVFFQSKQYQFNNDYLTIKKKSIIARPLQLTLPGFILFLFFFAITGYSVYSGFQQVMSSGIF